MPQAVSHHEWDVFLRIDRGGEEPGLDRIALAAHRRINGRPMKEKIVEEQHVARLEDRAAHGRCRRDPVDDTRTDGPRELGPFSASFNEAAETRGHDVESR